MVHSVSLDDGSPSVEYNSLFAFRPPLPPLVDFDEPSPRDIGSLPIPRVLDLLPAQPGTGITSWLWGTAGQQKRGTDVDKLCKSYHAREVCWL